MRDIYITDVDLHLLNKQRLDLYELLIQHPETYENGVENDLWGLLNLLDRIYDKYEHLMNDEENN